MSKTPIIDAKEILKRYGSQGEIHPLEHGKPQEEFIYIVARPKPNYMSVKADLEIDCPNALREFLQKYNFQENKVIMTIRNGSILFNSQENKAYNGSDIEKNQVYTFAAKGPEEKINELIKELRSKSCHIPNRGKSIENLL